MKRFFKSALVSFIIFAVIIGFANVVLADTTLGEGLNDTVLRNVTKKDTTLSGQFEGAVGTIYGTLYLIIRVACVAGIVIQGVRYMYAESGAKAKIKQSLIYIIVGTILVFGAQPILDRLVNAINEMAR